MKKTIALVFGMLCLTIGSVFAGEPMKPFAEAHQDTIVRAPASEVNTKAESKTLPHFAKYYSILGEWPSK
jgi:hypothetical protein